MIYSGDEVHPDDVTSGPDAFDPLDLPCDGCGAEIGEPCRFSCCGSPA